MQCYTELTPPTTVTHALCFPFLSPDSINLVVVRTSLLQVFSTKTFVKELDTGSQIYTSPEDFDQVTDRRILDNEGIEQSFLGVDAKVQRAERLNLTKLVLVAEYALSGTVLSLARIKLQHSKSGGEALLVAVQDAKLSLVEWDPERHGLSTISIHYYEQEELQKNPWAPPLNRSVNYLTADPRSRCAVLKFGSRELAVLPFRQAGDDLVMDDYDADIDGEIQDQSMSRIVNGNVSTADTPYSASFVLPITALDPTLIHPVHISFLYEYREPTFGVLSSPLVTSTSTLHERYDTLAYTVFTLDLEQRASTTILSVSGLPYDLYKIIPLPPPVGGTLLLGGNELVHVDQAGKTNGVAVNSFARDTTSFSMADQSTLEMKLEGCIIEQIDTEKGDMLMILNTGELAIVSFKLDGRSVSGLSVRRVSSDNGGHAVKAAASCAVLLTKGRMFIGSEDGDSVILGWSRRSEQQSKQRRQSEEQFMEDGIDEEDMDDYDDDLYGTTDSEFKRNQDTITSRDSNMSSRGTGEYLFKVHDSLLNIAPAKAIAFGYPASNSTEANEQDANRHLDLVVASGRGRAGGITILNRELRQNLVERFDLPGVTGVWTIRAKRPAVEIPSEQASIRLDNAYATNQEYDTFMIVSKSTGEGQEESAIYALATTGLEEVKGTDFDPTAGGTVDAGMMCKDTRVVQVLKGEIRSYDVDLALAQIHPLIDESTGAEPKILHISFTDPYLLLIKDDQTVSVIECHEDGDLEEVDMGETVTGQKWIAGCLYEDHRRLFRCLPKTDRIADKERNVLMFLISSQGSLFMFNLIDWTHPPYTVANVTLFPPRLSPSYTMKRSSAQAGIKDMLVAELGDEVARCPYVIFRTTSNEVILYEPFHAEFNETAPWDSSTLQLLKICSPSFTRSAVSWSPEETVHKADNQSCHLHAIPDLGGCSTVFIPGEYPCFLLRSAASSPKLLRVREKGIVGASGFHTKNCEKGWLYFDDEGVVRSAQFPSKVKLAELSWPARKIHLGEEVQALSYHAPMGDYVLGVTVKQDFELPKDDEIHRNWAKEDLSFKPQIDQGTVKLLTPINWTIIDSYPLQPNEVILCMSTITLCVSEHTDERKPLIAVGTSNTAIPDLPSRGTIYVFDIISVVPEPRRPETNHKLKLIAREEVKGAVTSLSEVGTQGFLLAAQGQKCMVRGLKEDGSLLPVAFMDMMCYVSVVRCLPGTGLCLMGDAWKGVWFVGYMEDPYKVSLFGKSTGRLEVISAEFLPSGDQLYILIADADSNIHILQFDPEHPKSLSGTHLLSLRIFHTGHFPSTLTRLPSTSPSLSLSLSPTPTSTSAHQTQILLTSQTGSINLLTQVPETIYRRLLTIQSHLHTTLEHACALNPRSYRLTGDAYAFGGERAVLDGCLLRRWYELDLAKRAEILSRVGMGLGIGRGADRRGGGAGAGAGRGDSGGEEAFREDFRAFCAGGAGDGVLGFF
ncbi:MAG: mRNA cleavage and polyadenylation factor subunit [Peltula sp. TS41687]|nr:MAG: mRNA cleavage and polyadenylation factor subunit [Peltula sp. TS41687]